MTKIIREATYTYIYKTSIVEILNKGLLYNSLEILNHIETSIYINRCMQQVTYKKPCHMSNNIAG